MSIMLRVKVNPKTTQQIVRVLEFYFFKKNTHIVLECFIITFQDILHRVISHYELLKKETLRNLICGWLFPLKQPFKTFFFRV